MTNNAATPSEPPVRVQPVVVPGDYVLATKYSDGDPGDQWAIGFYAGLTNPEKYDPPRYDVVDAKGHQFRGNGFRRIKKISKERGEWMLAHANEIDTSGISVWHFARCPIHGHNVPSPRPLDSAHTLATKIAASLFTSGDGKRASRLHFILESGDVWGGWSEPAVAAQIEKLLSAPNDPDQRPARK